MNPDDFGIGGVNIAARGRGQRFHEKGAAGRLGRIDLPGHLQEIKAHVLVVGTETARRCPECRRRGRRRCRIPGWSEMGLTTIAKAASSRTKSRPPVGGAGTVTSAERQPDSSAVRPTGKISMRVIRVRFTVRFSLKFPPPDFFCPANEKPESFNSIEYRLLKNRWHFARYSGGNRLILRILVNSPKATNSPLISV